MSSAAIPLTSSTDALTEKVRISSIDLMRGIVMVIMALDHSRDFFHHGALLGGYDPTNMTTTTPAIFFTRWITHFCAPTFVMLAGTSIYLSTQRKTKNELSLFLLSRGLWLIFIEVVVMRFSFFFNFYYDLTVLQVIWAIGASMVCMSLLTRLPYGAVVAIGFAILFGHNAFDAIPLKPGDSFYEAWILIRQAGFFPISDTGAAFFVPYPILPWLGIMILGFGLGKIFKSDFDPARRRKLLLIIGTSAIALFAVLRFINGYGDPAPWSVQKNALYTLMSFINTTKYPVSLMYTLMTLGPILILLSLFERVKMPALKPFIVFGRVPLFYYILHFYLIHIISLILFMNKTGKSFSELDFHIDKSFGGITLEGGYSLFWAYVGWLSVVVALYPLCRWYNEYKSRHQQWWLSYL
jgi:uncharacterized membrane protein